MGLGDHRGLSISWSTKIDRILTQATFKRISRRWIWPRCCLSRWMVVHGRRRDSCASRPVGIFPDGPIQGHAAGHENYAGGLPTAAFQHPMGGRFWRVAGRAFVSDFAVIWSSHLCMVAAATSDGIHRRCGRVNLWLVLPGLSTEPLAVVAESHSDATSARHIRSLYQWACDHIVGLSDDCVQRHRLLGLWSPLGSTPTVANLPWENSGRCLRRMPLYHGHGGSLRPCDGLAFPRFTRTPSWRPRGPHRHGRRPHRI